MDDQQIIGLVGQGGIAGALIFVIYKVGMAMVDAVKALRIEVAEHTKADLAAQADVREDLAALGARMDVIADVTPIRGTPKVRARTNPEGVGYYPPRKPGREDG